MKRLFLFVLLALYINAAAAQTKSINFRKGTMAEVLAQAKAENKPLFVDAYAVWCGPCKWMDKNVFANDTVADYFNANFVSYKINMEKGEGVDIAKKYNIRAYPSFLFLNADGTVMHRTVGAYPARYFTEIAKKALDPKGNFASYQQKYNAGERSPKFMLAYLNMKYEAALEADKEAEAYLSTQKPEQLQDRANWNIIYNYIENPESPSFQYLVKNREAFVKKFTADSVDTKLGRVYGIALVKAAAKTDKVKYEKLKAEIAEVKPKGADLFVLQADATYYENNKDFKNFHASNVKLAETHFMNDALRLNNLAWKYYEIIEDKVMLQQAEKWSGRAVELEPSFAYLDTHAALLFKTGQKEKARLQAEKAIAAGKKAGEDVRETEELLAKINKL